MSGGESQYSKKRVGYKKKDLIRRVQERTGYQMSKCERITNAVFNSIIELTKDGDPLFIEGFGSFRGKNLSERVIDKHFISEERATSEAHWRLSFKDYDSLRIAAGKMHRQRANRRYSLWGDDVEEYIKLAEERHRQRMKVQNEEQHAQEDDI
mgnify:CR=1 FL=1